MSDKEEGSSQDKGRSAMPKVQGDQPYYSIKHMAKMFPASFYYQYLVELFQKLLCYLPFFAARWRIDVQKLRPEDCFVVDEGSKPLAIVTGSNTGIGYETAKGLAERGYQVVLACRSQEKGEAAAKRIGEHLQSVAAAEDVDEHFVRGGEALFLCPLDLSSLASVRLFCKVFNENYDALNVLVNNAGTGTPGKTTEDGLDLIFQSNMAGHFLLTELLVEPLRRAKNKYHALRGMNEEAGRIVNLSSVTHHFASASGGAVTSSSKAAPVVTGMHDEQFWTRSATGLTKNVYAESKLAAVLFTMELNKRFGRTGIRSVAANPGAVFSDIWRNLPESKQRELERLMLNTAQGASTSIAGAVGAVPNDAFYLQPYWQPELRKSRSGAKTCPAFKLKYRRPFPLTEITGPYIGFAVTQPRLPADGGGGYVSSNCLWEVTGELVGKQLAE